MYKSRYASRQRQLSKRHRALYRLVERDDGRLGVGFGGQVAFGIRAWLGTLEES